SAEKLTGIEGSVRTAAPCRVENHEFVVPRFVPGAGGLECKWDSFASATGSGRRPREGTRDARGPRGARARGSRQQRAGREAGLISISSSRARGDDHTAMNAVAIPKRTPDRPGRRWVNEAVLRLEQETARSPD